jgi:hypothetical protein
VRIRAGAVVLGAAVLVAAAATAVASRPAESLAEPGRGSVSVPSTETSLPCPESPPRTSTKPQLCAVTPAGRDSTGKGDLTVATLNADAPKVIDHTTDAGVVVKRPLTTDDAPAVVVTGERSLAPGVSAAQVSVESDKTHAGLSASWCLAGADSWWFSGVTTSIGSTTRIVLTNPTPAISVADLHLYGPKGEISAVGARGIALAPESTESVQLSRFAPGLDALTVNVQATTGRVTAAIQTDEVAGVDPLGSEWIGPSSAPAETVLVDPGPADAVQQTLQITNPGESEVQVSVRAVGPDGAFTPSGFDNVRLKPGSVITKDVTSIVDKDPTGFLLTSLTSGATVTGAVVSTTSGPTDFTVTAPTTPLTDPAVVPVVDGADLTVAFSSAVKSGGQVTIQGFSAQGAPTPPHTVNAHGLITTLWTPPKGDKAAYYVISVTVPAQTQAVATYESKDGVTTLPVLSGTYTVSRPDVASRW